MLQKLPMKRAISQAIRQQMYVSLSALCYVLHLNAIVVILVRPKSVISSHLCCGRYVQFDRQGCVEMFNFRFAELHQLTSPRTAHPFMDSLLDEYTRLKSSVDDINLFMSYFAKSWTGIGKSSGIF
jgi:hypothetical protein